MSRVLAACSSNNSFHFFLETALHTAEKHDGANLRLTVTSIIMMFIVTRVRIVKYDHSFDVINTNRSTTCYKFT